MKIVSINKNKALRAIDLELFVILKAELKGQIQTKIRQINPELSHGYLMPVA